jgi:hypothetical protein
LNGQIQYGSARPLTLHPTVTGGAPRTTDPARFPNLTNVTRPVVLLFGSSLLLGALLTAAPRELPDLALVVALGGAWLSLVLAMTLPRQPERAGHELVRRLAQFRHEMNVIEDNPSRSALERMIARAAELDLRDEEVAEELAQLRACLDALTLKEALTRGEFPAAEPPDPLPPGERCLFVSPVRFGRRRSDQFGHLLLTSSWLKFRGALDLSVTWSEVASVTPVRRDIDAALQDSHRSLRFSCQSIAEAARGGVIAEHLAHAARSKSTTAPSPYHAAI